MKVIASKVNPPLGAVLTCLKAGVVIEWGSETKLALSDNFSLTASHSISRHIARAFNLEDLYPVNILHRTEVDHWLSVAAGPLSCSDLNDILPYINNAIAPSSYLTANSLTLADIEVFAAFYKSKEWQTLIKNDKAPVHVERWYKYILSQMNKFLSALPPEVDKSLSAGLSSNQPISINSTAEKYKREDGGKFVELPGAKKGEVVVRFPPEASGYLHIGHAKAALLNQYYQKAFQGKLIMRFDDTNPEKEKEDFEKVILDDLKLLEIHPDIFSHTSDYFEKILNYCLTFIKEGLAYVDDTEAELMKKEREEKKESKNRNNSVEVNLKIWQEMLSGTEYGQKFCVRAKIDMNSPNGCMRDPTIYRCKNELHVRTGDKYKVYPTYDFACPIVDSLEGVTHALRTTEYHDRDDQFNWFIEKLKLRPVHIYEYSRLNMNNTVLSKRKLAWFVEQRLVDGWDDPRFPTVKGILRHGMTVEGLKDFIVAQGSSRSIVNMEWDKIWAFNKKVIDRDAPRYTAIEGDLTPVFVNVSEQKIQAQKHPKDLSKGMKTLYTGPKVFIESTDAAELKENENATFINWGNLLIKKINVENGKVVSVYAEPNLENTDFKKTLKLTWLAETDNAPFTPVVCVYFENLISKPVLGKDEDFKMFVNTPSRFEIKMFGDDELKNLKVGNIIQLQRKGFFRVDEEYKPVSLSSCCEAPLVLFYIPDGHSKESPVLQLMKKKPGLNKKEAIKENKPTKLEKGPIDTTVRDSDDVICILLKIKEKGDSIRKLKGEGADKNIVMADVDDLKKMKSRYKEITGNEWKPDINIEDLRTKEIVNVTTGPVESKILQKVNNTVELINLIKEQGNKIRALKSSKAETSIIKDEVNILLQLKGEFKTLSGVEWTPDLNLASLPLESDVSIHEKIKTQGDKVRSLKTAKADKEIIKAEVNILLSYKEKFKNHTGIDWKPDIDIMDFSNTCAPPSMSKISNQKDSNIKNCLPVNSDVNISNKDESKSDSGLKKQTRLRIEVSKNDNLADWYSQIITKAELIEYYSVSGCYILRPWSFAIWEFIREFFDAEIKKLGVENAYFPIFVSKDALEKEKTHIADFSPEVAWVTKCGSSDMAEPVAIRPTSETVMYPAFAKWVQSYRDLPIKINQWNNVVRWEFKQPTPFLRTREFLWQEGHTAYATKEAAEEEVYTILDLYARIYEDLLSVPVIKGRKTEKEKFAGGEFTITTEAFVSVNGRAIQGATSHHLGQNFSTMFDIGYEDTAQGKRQLAYQNSWGITTRTIGVMVMVHGDDKGLVLPPRVAQIQTIILIVGITSKTTAAEKETLINTCKALESSLNEGGIRAKTDLRDNVTPAWKFNNWELKGVPLRLEVGPRELAKSQVFAVRRDTGEKQALNQANIIVEVRSLLNDIQCSLYSKAKEEFDSHIKVATNWNDFTANLEAKNVMLSPFCGEEECEDRIKKESARDETADPGAPSMGAKSLCIPFSQPGPVDKLSCISPACTNNPKFYTLFGRSY